MVAFSVVPCRISIIARILRIRTPCRPLSAADHVAGNILELTARSGLSLPCHLYQQFSAVSPTGKRNDAGRYPSWSVAACCVALATTALGTARSHVAHWSMSQLHFAGHALYQSWSDLVQVQRCVACVAKYEDPRITD